MTARKDTWRDILWRTKKRADEDNLSIIAAGLAFYIFFGLIPALAAIISIYGLIADPGTIKQQVDAMSGFLPQDVIKILDEQMTRIAQQSTGASFGAILGIVLALWSGAKATKSLMTTLNITSGVEETRGWIRLNATALALTLAGTLGVVIAVGTVVVLPVILNFVGIGSAAAVVVSLARWPVLALLAMFALALLYHYAPGDKRPKQHKCHWISWGAILATLGWLAISAGFSFYVSHFGKYNKTYGSLGAVVVLLLWFLLGSYVVLFGAELNSELETRGNAA